MEIYYHEVDSDVLVLAADGGLDAETASELVESVEKLVDAGLTRMIIDGSRLTFISSVGLGRLVSLNRRMRERGGEVKVCGLRGLVVQALQVTHLDRIFELHPDVEQARLAFRPRRTDPHETPS